FFDYPASGPLTAELYRTLSGARIDIDKQVTKQRVRLATTFLLPLMILATAFALLFSLGRATSSAIGEVMTFGTIGRGKAKRSRQAVTFEDVGGAEEAVAELREVRDYLTDPDKYEALGAAPPKGVLLFGPPGCGKTLLAKAVAGEANVPFFSISGAEFVESLVGVGAARVRDLFQRVRAVAPAIVFIDELDAAARKRGGGGGGGGSDEREQTLNQLLVEMDGFEVSAGIVVIGATNRPDILDPAIMRPGRFDRHITIERPEHEGREHILRIHAKGKPIAPDVDFTYLADRTPGFTGADLANVVNEAALLTIRLEKELIEPPEFMEAIQRVLSGPKRRGRLLTDEERERTAYHEAGHVVVAAAAGHAEEVHRVSILARGRAVATTDMHSDADASLLTHSQLRGRLVAKLAGIATENLIYGEGSTGGEQDLEEATTLARDMVARYGFSPRLGPVRLLAKSSAGFLQEDTPLGDLAPETREAVDTEIRRLIAEAQAEATAILSRHRKTLDGLAARLQAEETLEGDVLQEVLKPISKEMSSEHIGPNGRTNGRTGTRTRNNGSGNVKVRSARSRAAATRHR
ncbi:MAG TPA: ATP-dependent zinc metalloprotease FtsH, partial [Mycobacteriales bacterium]|nr:ATP-dependent zinc metalloprotease FtsH [Mycobacteriales bacterium]